MTGEEIYRNFTEGPGGGELAEAARLARELRDEHEHDADEIRSLAVLMEAAWQGEAAGAAQRGAVPLAVEHELSAPLLFTDQDLFSRQVESFDDARNRVVPVPPAPEKPPGIGILFQPGALPTYQHQLAEHNAAAESNVDIMMSYEDASAFNAANLPGSYGSLAPDAAGISVAPRGDDGVGPYGGDGGGPSGGRGDDGGPEPARASWPPPASSGDPGSPAADPVAPIVGASPQDTRSHGYVPPPGLTAPAPIVVEPVGGGSATGGPPPVGAFVRGDGGAGAGRAGGRAGAPGDAGGRPGAGGDARHGIGGRAGLASAESAVRGLAAGRGVAEAGVPVGAGAVRGRGGEDEDYKRKPYLEAGDPDGLYGSDAMTVPPVIGEDEEDEA